MKAKIPECLQLDPNNTCQLAGFSYAISDDGDALRLDLFDKRGQHIPLAMTLPLLSDLLLMAVLASQDMAAKKGDATRAHILRGYHGKDLPPLHYRMSWSAVTQKMTLIIGNLGLEVPMDAQSALEIGQGLVEKASKHAAGKPSKH